MAQADSFLSLHLDGECCGNPDWSVTLYRFILQADINLKREEERKLRAPTTSSHKLNVIYLRSVDLGLTVLTFRGSLEIFPHSDHLKIRVTRILPKTKWKRK